MRVLVTGGTGFVGSHAVGALLRHGHDVRLLVRRPEQVPVTFGALGVDHAAMDVVVGDVTDADSVRRAVSGCQAAVHAAAIFSLDSRRSREMGDTNAAATRLVLDESLGQGLAPVVHVSSTVTLVRYGGTTPDLPLGDMDLPYSRSKIESERVAREHQDAGRPVVSVYPGSVYGPHDPYCGEQAERLRWVARGLFPLWPRGRLHNVDVRDTAEVVAASLGATGPGRYVVPGHAVDGDEHYDTVARVLGRRRPHLEMSRRVTIAATVGTDLMQRWLPGRLHYPADREGAELALRDTTFDTGPAERDLGVQARPFEESIRDTIGWLVEAGHLPEKYRPR